MPILIPYLLKLFISLSIVFLFYHLVLRRLTFYNANRWFLLSLTLLSFFIPLVNITPVVNEDSEGTLVRLIPSIQNYSIGLEEASNCPVPLWSSNWNKWDWILFAFSVGAAVFLLRFLVRCFSFFRLKSRATLISENGLKIYQVNESIIPFSFGNSIFINSSQHTEAELSEIIRHEFIHVKQRHTADILWAELLCMLNWYNPVAWLLRSAIRQNLEFIADHKVLENGIDKKQYQYLLLKVIGNDQFSIAQKFNFSSLKKRIAMMNKTKSARVHLFRFLFMLPVAAIILISFREQLGQTDPIPPPTILKDTIPEVKTPNTKGFIINIRDNKGNCMVEVKDRQGKLVENLLLTKWNQSPDLYEQKYGDIPPPPPPDEPAHPATPPYPLNPVVPAAPAKPATPPLPPVPAIEKLIAVSDDFEITDTKASIVLKDGKLEEYDLTKPESRKKFEAKYGQITPSQGLAPVAIIHHDEGQQVVAPVAPIEVTAMVESIPGNDNTAQITGNEDIVVTITKYTSKQQLETYRRQMKEKGVELTYDEIEYDTKGILVTISGTLKSNTGRSNFTASDFQKLMLAMIRKGDKTTFKINVSNTKEVVKTRDYKTKPAQAVTPQLAPTKPATKPAFLIDLRDVGKKGDDGC